MREGERCVIAWWGVLESGRPVAADGASINEAATCITWPLVLITSSYVFSVFVCVCVCVCVVCGVCSVCVCGVCVCVCVCGCGGVGVSILASRGSDQLMV